MELPNIMIRLLKSSSFFLVLIVVFLVDNQVEGNVRVSRRSNDPKYFLEENRVGSMSLSLVCKNALESIEK